MDVMDQARLNARDVLAKCPAFRQLSRPEQMAMYQDMVGAMATELTLAGGRRPASRAMGAGLAAALADPNEEFRNTRIDQAGQLVGDFVQEVDFPGFVRDLLKGVFDANLEVTLRQMEEYIKLMKAATQALTDFVKKIPDEDAMYQLAESSPDFTVMPNPAYTPPPPGEPPPEPVPGGPPPAPPVILGDKDGNPRDIGDNMVKAKILETKLAMAQEQRALLRETILMGITRLVVEKGTVKAACNFKFQATENITRSRMTKTTSERGGGASAGISVGPFSFGGSYQSKSTRISMSTATGTQSASLQAELMGSVEIVFKSDYFKLDNFAEMYGQIKAAAPSGAAPAAAAPPAPGR